MPLPSAALHLARRVRSHRPRDISAGAPDSHLSRRPDTTHVTEAQVLSMTCPRYRVRVMSNVCQVTGRKPSFGNNVSHSQRKTRRRWDVNIQTQRFYVPSEKRWVKLKVSAKGLKTINKKGIETVLADMRRRGVKV